MTASTALPVTRPIRVGIIGLSAGGGWAARGHLPALAALDGFEVTALCASSEESARAAGEAFGVHRTFGSAEDLARCDDVDLIVVAVQAARHRDVVVPALEAGKAVYCEWPLATDAAEAAGLVDLAERNGLRTVVGLQSRSAPVIRYLRDLIADGWVGDVLSSSLIASGMAWGPESDGRTEYLLDRRGGSTMLAIPFGHALDALVLCLGEFTEFTAVTANRRPWVRDSATGDSLRMTTEDQVVVQGVVEGGAVVSLHFRGGVSRATNFHWEINGTEGDLVLTGAHGHLQLAPVRILGARGGGRSLSELAVPAEYHLVPEFRGRSDDPAANLANAYAALLTDAPGGWGGLPDFAHGLRLHRVLETIQRSASAGRRLRVDGPVTAEVNNVGTA